MNLLERMVVTPEFCAREDTYNINVGGDGGWSYVNENKLNMSGNWANIGITTKNFYEANGYYPGTQAHLNKLSSDCEYHDNFCQKVSDGVKRHIQ